MREKKSVQRLRRKVTKSWMLQIYVAIHRKPRPLSVASVFWKCKMRIIQSGCDWALSPPGQILRACEVETLSLANWKEGEEINVALDRPQGIVPSGKVASKPKKKPMVLLPPFKVLAGRKSAPMLRTHECSFWASVSSSIKWELLKPISQGKTWEVWQCHSNVYRIRKAGLKLWFWVLSFLQ